eukprot:gnl/TRDRNA2_/TRDRNA2_32906_c0_seq1.p1 gnl/TRDRNA2_/TRDRNA2_32906_c0~~gnl/TRDRNA2_/TRDRNA2_32906_c0_seq1.p1  ORF type:complete len:159 (+),score=10.16 gnl/TRDRNA2_/TRDRNA2_32906_c0_seq1:328-804(+)
MRKTMLCGQSYMSLEDLPRCSANPVDNFERQLVSMFMLSAPRIAVHPPAVPAVHAVSTKRQSMKMAIYQPLRSEHDTPYSLKRHLLQQLTYFAVLTKLHGLKSPTRYHTIVHDFPYEGAPIGLHEFVCGAAIVANRRSNGVNACAMLSSGSCWHSPTA